jgi:hypothetical protein
VRPSDTAASSWRSARRGALGGHFRTTLPSLLCRRAQVWGLGLAVVEMATGEPLFQGHTAADMLSRTTACQGPLPPRRAARMADNAPLALAAAAAPATQPGSAVSLTALLGAASRGWRRWWRAACSWSPRRGPPPRSCCGTSGSGCAP